MPHSHRLPTELFLEAFNEQRFTDSELKSIQNGFYQLREWLKNPSLVDATSVSPVFSQMYLLANSNESILKDSLSICNQIIELAKIREVPDSYSKSMGTLWLELQASRIESILSRINDKQSLTQSEQASDFLSAQLDKRATELYNNKSDKLDIDFQVTQLPFPMEVLDPRLVRVAPGKTNELHKHAHETLFVFLEGEGKVIIDKLEIPVKSGDFVYVPRWCMHQSVNTNAQDLVFLAVADFGLTGKSFTGNYLKTARLKA